MIAFIEGGMRIPMGRVMRDYLRFYHLAPTQCVPNIFRILGCVDALNEKIGLGLTHHDVNWVYNLHHLKGKGYYLKMRQPKIRLIQCLPESTKGLNKDFLIIPGRWHDGLPCPTQEGQLGVVLEVGKVIYFLLYSDLCYLTFNDLYLMPVVDRRATEPNFSLVNREGLDKILKAEVFVNEDDRQLQAAHLILGITPISHAFQAPKCVIKAHVPRLRRISVDVEGFLLPEGAPILEGTFSTQPILFLGPTTEGTQSSTPIPEGIPKVRASSSQQFTRIATLLTNN